MARISSHEMEKDAVRVIASLMAVATRTAPKARGVDDIETLIVDGDDLETLAAAMEAQAKKHPGYYTGVLKRDAKNVREARCVVLVGCHGVPKGYPRLAGSPLDCGACGYEGCTKMAQARTKQGNDFSGPVCIIQAIDLGIALGSAVKTAMDLNTDNRIMYSVGAAAKQLGWLDADVIMGVPLSVSGKSPYFDRPPVPPPSSK